MLAHADIDDSGPAPGAGARRERLCVVTRAVKPVDELIRFVVAPDGAVVPDLKRRLPGRGVWVTATPRRRRRGGQAQRLSPAASSARSRAAPDLAAEVERQLERAALDALGIAHKAGRVATGFAKTEGGARRRSGGGGPAGRRRGPPTGRARSRPRRQGAKPARMPAEIPVVAAFTSAQLDLALGRSNVVHAALLAGPASNGFLARCQSLERFRTIDPGGRGTG